MIVIGLTGSIGMGKSTAGAMFQTLGVPVHEADEEVHALLAPGAAGYKAVCRAFPLFKYPQIYGKISKKIGLRPIKRAALGALIFKDDKKRERLESLLHPLVRKAQIDFIRLQKAAGRDMVVLDIPLLFETGADRFVDITVNVSAPPPVQKARVLARPGMNEKKFLAILSRQMPDGEKSARADFVLNSGLSRAHMMKQVKAILKNIRDQKAKDNG